MYMKIAIIVVKLVSGEERDLMDPNKCKDLLLEAGCDDKGFLLDKHVCLNSNYRKLRPPNAIPTVYVSFRQWPKVLIIDEDKGIIKIQVEMAFIWNDRRVQIKVNKIENGQLFDPKIPNSEKVMALNSPIEEICNPSSNEENLKIWNPFVS